MTNVVAALFVFAAGPAQKANSCPAFGVAEME
jgi:hypothetical protein